MADRATISILALYEWDDSLFDNLVVPKSVDKNLVVENILHDGAELELLYPDWQFMRHEIGVWSKVHKRDFEKFMEAAGAEFSPVENYDRYEEYTDQRDEKWTGVQNVNSSTEETGNTKYTGDDLTTNQHKVAAYNENNATLKNETTSDVTSNDVTDTTNTRTDTGSSDTTNNGTVVNAHNAHLHGNIGVTTAPQMLKEFLEITPMLNIYNYITDMFVQHFCLLVY